MKKYLIFGWLSCLLLLGSCGNTDELISNVSAYRLVKGETAVEINCPTGGDTAVSTMSYVYYSPADSAFKDSINEMIVDYTKAYANYQEAKNVDTISEEFFQEQLMNFASSYYEDCENGIGGVWSLDMTHNISEYSDYVEITMSNWVYAGGAHGNWTTSNVLMEKSSTKILNLADFISDKEALNTIAEPLFRELAEVDAGTDWEEAGFWFENNEFSVNENFYFTGEAMIFDYDPYEIAPYVAGSFELAVPLSKIMHLLKRSTR